MMEHVKRKMGMVVATNGPFDWMIWKDFSNWVKKNKGLIDLAKENQRLAEAAWENR